jgi:hypothetical protein
MKSAQAKFFKGELCMYVSELLEWKELHTGIGILGRFIRLLLSQQVRMVGQKGMALVMA